MINTEPPTQHTITDYRTTFPLVDSLDRSIVYAEYDVVCDITLDVFPPNHWSGLTAAINFIDIKNITQIPDKELFPVDPDVLHATVFGWLHHTLDATELYIKYI